MKSHIFRIAGRTVKKQKLKTAFMVIAITGSIISALIPPLVLEKIVDRLTQKEPLGILPVISYLLVLVISGVFESLQNILITMVGQRMTHEMRSVMAEKLPRLPASYFTKNETGQITSRFVNDVDAVDDLFTNGIISMFADAFKVISILIVIFTKSVGLGLLMLVVTPLLFLMTMIFRKRMRAAQIDNRKAVARVNHHVPETIENIRMIRNLHAERFMEKKYRMYIEDGYHAIDRSNFYDAVYSPIIIFVSTLVIAVMMVCAAAGAGLQTLFGMTVGSAVAVIAYVGKVFDPLESIGMEIQNIQSALAGIARIDEFLDEPEIERGAEKVKDHEAEPLISFENVDFSYDGDKKVVNGLSLDIKRGESVILAGRTGAGKSTIMKLMLGLYRPDAGGIRVCGADPFKVRPGERRKLFGCVEQSFSAAEGTVGDQISLKDPEISEEAVLDALEKTGMKEKILALPEGLETPMEKAAFSQGELQLLSIARALVSDPEVLLLDEITANLDSLTEERIFDAIRSAAAGRTVVSISHRLRDQLDNARVINI